MGEGIFDYKTLIAAGIVGIGVLLYLVAAAIGPIDRSEAYKGSTAGTEVKNDKAMKEGVKSLGNRRDLKKRKKKRNKNVEKSKKELEKVMGRVENESGTSKLPPPVF